MTRHGEMVVTGAANHPGAVSAVIGYLHGNQEGAPYA